MSTVTTIQRIACLWLTALLMVAAKSHVISQSRDFPLGYGPENLVLRPSGSALVAIGTSPRVYQVATAVNAVPKLLHEFPDALGVSSIAYATQRDNYFVITGNYSYDTLTPMPASYIIHRLSFDHGDEAVVEELSVLSKIAQPNGMIHVPDTPYVLIADCYGGYIYRYDTITRETITYFDHPLLKPQPEEGFAFGVNGLKLSRGYLYFSNTNQRLVARIRATGLEKCLRGSPQILATQAPVDDFIVDDRNGDLFMAFNVANALGYLSHRATDTVPQIILGGGNSTDVLGPTAAIWAQGAEGRDLLVTVTGGFAQYTTHNYTGGARVERIRIDGGS